MTIPDGAPEKAKALFFSYAHADRDRAAAIISALEAAGHEVWWDDNIEGGSAFSSSIEAALNAAKAVIVLWSPTSIKSHWVSDEAAQGRDRGCLVPLTIDGAHPPLGFRQLHFIDMEAWRGDEQAPEFVRLQRALAAFTDGTPPPPVTTPSGHYAKASRPGDVSRRTLMMAGGGIVGVGALAFLGSRMLTPASKLLENGVAVLPFRNLSGDPEQDYLSAGLSAEVRSVLARNAALRVVAQASSEAVKERALSAAEMAQTLAVSFLLDGNVTRVGENLRVAADLIDGRTGFSRWSQTFERPMTELLTVQSAIANAVTSELASDAGTNDAQGFGNTQDASAFNDYLKGKELYAAAISLETDLAALTHFDRALQRDPSFGAAHAARARLLTVLGNTSDDIEKASLYYSSAQQAARRAVETGASSADAHSTLGYVLFQAQLRIKEAREPYERSYALGQGEATVLARYAGYAASTKQFFKAEKAVLAALNLDPLNATIHRAVGFVKYAARDFAGANTAVERALALNPKLSDSHARIAMGELALGNAQSALTIAAKEKSGLVRYPALAIGYHRAGDPDQANGALAKLVDDYGDAGLYQQAQILASSNREDEAMEILARARELGDSGLTYAFIDPALDPLRERADFKALLVALGYV